MWGRAPIFIQLQMLSTLHTMVTEQFLPQRPSDDHNWLPGAKPTISKLPVEILLWIFDFYRQSFSGGCIPKSEWQWNRKNGWFKLAHVCRRWRWIVLSSPSRLRLQLYFTDCFKHRTRACATVPMGLPPLPIFVDYSYPFWSRGSQDRFISALRYPNRVCGIALDIIPTRINTVYKTLDTCFPMLEVFAFFNQSMCKFDFPPTFLMTSMTSLRKLMVVERLASLPPLLSATTALVYLTLNIDVVVCPQPGVSLLVLLQCLPRLRYLSLIVRFFSPSIHALQVTPTKTNAIVSLAELTYFHFEGHSLPVEEFVAGLATPSLRELHVSLYPDYAPADFHIPHLSKFIRNAGMILLAAQFRFTRTNFNLSLLTHSHFDDDPPVNIIGNKRTLIAPIGRALSAILATIEDITLAFLVLYAGPFRGDLAPWCSFFGLLQNVKILRVQHGLERKVANMFRKDNGRPTTDILPAPEEEANLDATILHPDMPINSRQFNLGLLPSLERIEVYMKSPGTPIPESKHASALEPFDALVAARRQAGRPVTVYWNADQLFPASFYDRHDWHPGY